MKVVKETEKEMRCEGQSTGHGCGSTLLIKVTDITERKSYDCDGDPCGTVKGFVCPLCKAFTDVDMDEFSKETA